MKLSSNYSSMFKLESYITPVILSYVEKYVKNFKPEQSQVSLWGGDASFKNLDLRLEVLEEQLNLPFTFVSGHIHELLIHVPWVKITSEPIVITINTIECILKLKDKNQSENVAVATPETRIQMPREEAPPGYIKNIVTKVINTITINCNNLILKYVEEDIVLSINVRFLSMQTVNNKWEPAFTDISGYEVRLQKLITIQDLTLCLDKMGSSGKIEVYQDPVLYRCSMSIRLIRNYHSIMAKRASIIRLDLHCEQMEFSITEQQIPMILRLVALITLLQSRQIPNDKETTSTAAEEADNSSKDESIEENRSEDDTWGMWAWNTVSSILPVDWQNDWSNEQHNAYSGHVLHFGFYIDNATITFKTVESVKEQLFYKPRKIKYKSFLSLRIAEVVFSTILQGISLTYFTVSFGTIRLFPRGTCSCGFLEVIDGVQPNLYLSIGQIKTDYLKGTLFDSCAIENKGKKRIYGKDYFYYLQTVHVFLKTKMYPAFRMDFIHDIEIPDDILPETLADFGSNYEYSNFIEQRYVSYAIGDLVVRPCIGLFHRIEAIKKAADKYDYSPYNTPKPIPSFEELPPVTVEEYEALRERIPMVTMTLNMIKISVQFILSDHRITGIPRVRKYVENRTLPLTPAFSDDPYVSLQCEDLCARLEEPLYPFRLVACASKQTKIPPEMLKQCYRDIEVQLKGVGSQVHLKWNCRTSIIMPCNISYNLRMILYPMYWENLRPIKNLQNLNIDSITFTGSKTKFMVATSIITSLLYPEDTTNPLLCSSLFTDSCDEKNPIYIELCLENIVHKGIMSMITTSCIIDIKDIKVFVHNKTHQAFILSGPELDNPSENDQMLVTAVVQFSKEFNNQKHPTILSFRIAPMKGCLDPLILQWLNYSVTYYKLNTTNSMKPKSIQTTTESVISDTGGKKRTFPSLHESVHSSSDKEKRKLDEAIEKSNKVSINKSNESDKGFGIGDVTKEKISILGRLTEFYPWWSGLVLNGSVEHIVIYIPTKTMSGTGLEGIEEAKHQSLQNDNNLQILVIKLPIVNIHSSNIQPKQLYSQLNYSFNNNLPIELPKNMWIHQIHSFPWTLEILNFESFTLKENLECNFIKKVCFKATFDLTVKDSVSEKVNNKLSALSLCLYIDTSPVIISISEEQVILLCNAFTNIANLLRTFWPSKVIPPSCNNKDIKDLNFTIPRSSSSPTQFPYAEDATSTSTTSIKKENTGQDEDDLQLTASIQWTITKVSVKLYIMDRNEYPTLKLVLLLEDIITSVDIQSVYLKLKHKITTATIFHCSRESKTQKWSFGDYLGLILCGREDNFEKSDDSGFMGLTLTIAKSGNVHTRWGAHKSYKTQKKDSKLEALQPTNAYITEAVVKIQMVDIIIPPSILAKYIEFVKPLLNKKPPTKNPVAIGKYISTPCIGITNLRNESLPLIYLEFKGLRLMLPVASDSIRQSQHDLLMLWLDSIEITPHAENPICRIPLRTDIYQLAAQANILNVPGSAVEDRQYQINVNGICAETSTWKNYQQSVAEQMSKSCLFTMNENPAVEWNKLGNGSIIESYFPTLSLMARLKFCFIIAPVIMFKPDTMVCASAAEINCFTDLKLTINLNQIILLSTLYTQFKNLIYSDELEETQIFETKTRFKKTTISINSKHNSSIKQAIIESETDFTKDSGVDLESTSVTSEKSLRETLEFPPFEFLVNCGKITIVVYDIKKTIDLKYVIDGCKVQDDDVNFLKQPLFYAMIDQSNFYYSQKNFDQKMQMSCFDVALFLGNVVEEYSSNIPTKSDFKVCLIETKSGEVHPDTGIPPSFLVVKFDVPLGKSPQLNISMGRPTKTYFSLSRLKDILYIRDKMSPCFTSRSWIKLTSRNNSVTSTCYKQGCMDQPSLGSSKMSTVRKYNMPDINITSKQLVLSFKSASEAELIFSLASITVNVSSVSRPERIYGNVTCDSLIVSTILDSNITVLLNPCSCNLSVSFLWESWQNNPFTPQIQIQMESDCMYLDIGPKQIIILTSVFSEFDEIVDKFTSMQASRSYDEESTCLTNHEQHYKDDLKSGAFQFVDGNAEDLPFPYQVVFFSSPQQAMAWRYPHPRALTKIHVSPVPFESSEAGSRAEGRVPCAIEYWSESQMSYQRYVDLYISETESYRLDLPDKTPLQSVACVWRIVLLPDPEMAYRLSSKSLIGCLRIDSYFNPLIVPKIQAALNLCSFHVSFYNHLDENFYETLPPPLSDYKLNGMIPETQCFALLEYKKASFAFSKWSDGSLFLSLSGKLSLHLLNYGLLHLQEVLDTVKIKAQVSFTETTDSTIVCQPFSLKISPSTFHTVALAAHLWNNAFDPTNKYTLVLTARFVIANDTNIPIRFGQCGTNDNILLESRQCHFYSWRVSTSQVLQIAIEENGWIWSKPFSVCADGNYHTDFGDFNLNTIIFINVVSISASEKLVTFTGQLIISNQMLENFELKLVKYDIETNNKSVVFRDSIISGNSKPYTIVLTDDCNMAMRLRFTNVANLFWTGDIPLQPNARWGQPWLVKVPLQERGQFISVWVRIIVESISGRNKILAIISPLYMIKSYLPVSADVQIETPLLNALLNTVVNGRGERQQLYCPGTFEHFHQLTFQIESGVSASNPFVPLSYDSVDQRNFFKRPEKESIQDILKTIESMKDELKWPFQIEESHMWIAADQPQTHVQVKYEDAGFGSSTLLLELQPWCFILNSFGLQLSIVTDDVELCRIPHYGVVAPPKIQGVFYIGLNISKMFYLSPALQLVSLDWSKSFYLPRIEGMIPMEGNLKTSLKCQSSICMMSVTSSVHKDMRVIRISSNYVIGNMTNYELQVATLVVSNSMSNLTLPDDLTSRSIYIAPLTDERYAIPIVQWHTLYEKLNEPYALYISLRLTNKVQWSCPVRVDKNLSRRCIALPNGHSTLPIIVTTQEDKSSIYIMIHKDKYPQLFIENMCLFKILICERNEETERPVLDAEHFSWLCQVEGKSSCHYSMPSVGSRLPDLSSNYDRSVSMIMSANLATEESFDNRRLVRNTSRWSRSINLSIFPTEQLVKLPNYGDVKLNIQTRCYTTFVYISPFLQAEISAQDVRNKIEKKSLQREESETTTDNYSPCFKEERILSNLQSVSSSTSTATFLSAQDDVLDTDSSSSTVSLYNASQLNRLHRSSTDATIVDKLKRTESKNGSTTIHLQGFSIVVMKDINENSQRIELTSLCMIDIVMLIDSNKNNSKLRMYIGDLQLDNQMFDHGGFDFPVVLISQNSFIKKDTGIHLTNSLRRNIRNIVENCLIGMDLTWEYNNDEKVYKDVSIKIAPIRAYIEGAYLTLLTDYVALILPPCFIASTSDLNKPFVQSAIENSIYVPDYILLDTKTLSYPLRLQSFVIEPLSIMLSVHTSVHLYVAFDRSPLYFEVFDRINVIATPYRLGNALAMHYLSGAIFGIGWVVGSLEILGSPGGLAQALGSGLKDFISMPFQGLLQGPWGFIVGITHGSASLVKHITAGTVNSVTKLASSVARNLDRLTLDEEHLQRQEESRRLRPQGVAQGLYQGLTGLGMSLLAAVAGLAHHPLQQVLSGETSTRGLITGVGLGLVGVVTKPLSGAAELVALAGQGLLQGTGWSSLPSPRHRPVVQYSNESSSPSLRYSWRMMPLLRKHHDSILYVSSADHVILQDSNRAVNLVLTRQALMIVNVADDSVEKIYPLKQLIAADHPSEPSMFRLSCSSVSPPQRLEEASPVEQVEVQMDQEMRARVAEFLRTSSTEIASVSTNSDAQSEIHDPEPLPDSENSLIFYINSDSRDYLLSVFNVAKRQNENSGFAVL